MAYRHEPGESPTEAVLEGDVAVDALATEDVVAAIYAEDRRAVEAVAAVLPQIARAAELLSGVLEAGGRWFDVGAGTSGRLGCADAAELPPTFGVEPHRVVGVIAGGPAALARAIEAAEDDAEGARRALAAEQLSPHDAVLAISASGRTPFALSALAYARDVGGRRLALTCDPASPLAAAAEIVIAPAVGPAVIAGSTRMKGGLATKMVLHQLSTTVMVRLGRVERNRMTHLRPGSRKLWRRAVGLVAELGEVDEETARTLLAQAGGSPAAALRALRDRSA
jgi:N-acetylmuramic acid 6-phosphate etherase